MTSTESFGYSAAGTVDTIESESPGDEHDSTPLDPLEEFALLTAEDQTPDVADVPEEFVAATVLVLRPEPLVDVAVPATLLSVEPVELLVGPCVPDPTVVPLTPVVDPPTLEALVKPVPTPPPIPPAALLLLSPALPVDPFDRLDTGSRGAAKHPATKTNGTKRAGR